VLVDVRIGGAKLEDLGDERCEGVFEKRAEVEHGKKQREHEFALGIQVVHSPLEDDVDEERGVHQERLLAGMEVLLYGFGLGLDFGKHVLKVPEIIALNLPEIVAPDDEDHLLEQHRDPVSNDRA
jgi:hypothetical protein